MEKAGISFFKELYYWMYIYLSKTIGKINKYQNIRFGASGFLSILRVLNVVSLQIFIEWILNINEFEYENYYANKKMLSNYIFIIMIFDCIYFTRKSNFITTTCDQFSKKRRIIGQIKFWIYVALTILFFQYVDGLRNSMG